MAIVCPSLPSEISTQSSLASVHNSIVPYDGASVGETVEPSIATEEDSQQPQEMLQITCSPDVETVYTKDSNSYTVHRPVHEPAGWRSSSHYSTMSHAIHPQEPSVGFEPSVYVGIEPGCYYFDDEEHLYATQINHGSVAPMYRRESSGVSSDEDESSSCLYLT